MVNYKRLKRRYPYIPIYRAVAAKLRKRSAVKLMDEAVISESTTANVYFDESGFTGNNLLNERQKIFCYASVVTTDEEAEKLVNHIISKYHIQNGEIKGGKLIKGVKGKRAIDEILIALEGNIKVSVSDKKYALAGKFFEYIFEPVLQRANSIFYNANFHKFISNILYLELVQRGALAEEIFEDFENLMRSGDFSNLKSLFTPTVGSEIFPPLELICKFAILNKDSIVEELNGYAGEGAGKWVLDLTNTALFSLLANWGQEYDELTAYCDHAKPLSDDQTIFNAMVGRKDKVYTQVAGFDSPITFNLSQPLNLVDSKVVHGVQLADAVSAAFAYACDSENTDEYAIKWRGLIEDTAIYGSVFPDIDHIDLTKIEAQRNAVILQELVDRSESKQDLLDGMGQLMRDISIALKFNPLLEPET